jgi:hypothetical protein
VQIPINLGRLHAKQSVAFHSPATEILYGGAAGGGKSHLFRAATIRWCADIPGLQCYLFRRELGDLNKNHMDGPKGFRSVLAPWKNARLVEIVDREIRFWNGSKINLCHAKNPDDVYGYDGSEIHLLLIDEITQWLEWMYRFLRHRVRAPGLRVPPQYAGMFPRILAGTNPGNIGHAWVKATWIDGAQPLEIRRVSDSEGGMLRQFIPALLEDNPSMEQDDPGYTARLLGMGSGELVKAKRFGLWDIVAGAYFDEIRKSVHGLKPMTFPAHWTRYRSMDWGSAKPFSVGWWVIVDEPIAAARTDGSTVILPRGALVRYREWYGAKVDPETGRVKPDEGLKMTVEEVADGILEREYKAKEKIDGQLSVADPSMWIEDGGPSRAERLMSYVPHGADWLARGDKPTSLVIQPADNSRIPGWDQMRARMKWTEDEPPELYVLETCSDWWRTVPVLQHDKNKPEDLDSDGEDHAADDSRYACMARPTSRVPKKKAPTGPAPWSFDWVVKNDRNRQHRVAR